METFWIGDGFIGVGEDRDISVLFCKIESNLPIVCDVVRIEFVELGVKVLLHL